jgi:hypothetical protein
MINFAALNTNLCDHRCKDDCAVFSSCDKMADNTGRECKEVYLTNQHDGRIETAETKFLIKLQVVHYLHRKEMEE